jgi:hypothetical protein
MVLIDFGEGFDDYALEKQKNKFSSLITTMVTPNFYQVWERKSNFRSTISKKWSNYTSQVSNTYAKVEWELRLVRV